jgi:hypothetical protein
MERRLKMTAEINGSGDDRLSRRRALRTLGLAAAAAYAVPTALTISNAEAQVYRRRTERRIRRRTERPIRRRTDRRFFFFRRRRTFR